MSEGTTLTWRAYVEYILGRGNVEDFMIVSSSDGSHWASNGDFMVSISLNFE